MSLKVLVLEEEPEMEIQYVPLASSEENQPEPELPEEFLILPEDIVDLDDAVVSLESIIHTIDNGGMDMRTARALDKISPGFIFRTGGNHVFTSRPSLEGLVEGAEAVKNTLGPMITRLRQFVAEMFKRFRDWITSKFSSGDNNELQQEVEEFLAQRRNHDAIRFISELPEDPEEAASEIAILMDGDTKTFATAFIDQIQSSAERVKAIEKMLAENHTQFYLVTGKMTVKELYAQDELAATLKTASAVAQRAMLARHANEFEKAMQGVEEMIERLKGIQENLIIQDKKDPDASESNVSLLKMYENMQQVSKDMQSVDVQQLVSGMTAAVNEIIKTSEGTNTDDISEMIPDDVPQEKHRAYAQRIAALYKEISTLGSKTLRLWKIRADSVASINKVGTALLSLVDGFEKAVVGAGTSLTPEQKTQLAKALAGKGLKIVF